jgi:hypothetical protein
MPEEVKEVPKEEKKKGFFGKVKEAATDHESQLEAISTMVRLGILVWSGGILEQKLDPTFIASVFTGVLATFGVQTAKKSGDGTMKMGGAGGVSKADLERLIAAAAQTAPAQTIRIEQAPIQIATAPAPKKDGEPPVMPTV